MVTFGFDCSKELFLGVVVATHGAGLICKCSEMGKTWYLMKHLGSSDEVGGFSLHWTLLLLEQ